LEVDNINNKVIKSAFDYSLTRKTGTPCVVNKFLRKYINSFTDEEQQYYIQSIENADRNDKIGADSFWFQKPSKIEKEDYKVFNFCVCRGAFRANNIKQIKESLDYIVGAISDIDNVKQYIEEHSKESGGHYQALFGKWSKEKKKIFKQFITQCEGKI